MILTPPVSVLYCVLCTTITQVASCQTRSAGIGISKLSLCAGAVDLPIHYEGRLAHFGSHSPKLRHTLYLGSVDISSQPDNQGGVQMHDPS